MNQTQTIHPEHHKTTVNTNDNSGNLKYIACFTAFGLTMVTAGSAALAFTATTKVAAATYGVLALSFGVALSNTDNPNATDTRNYFATLLSDTCTGITRGFAETAAATGTTLKEALTTVLRRVFSGPDFTLGVSPR